MGLIDFSTFLIGNYQLTIIFECQIMRISSANPLVRLIPCIAVIFSLSKPGFNPNNTMYPGLFFIFGK
jgi:hypothetical protein